MSIFDLFKSKQRKTFDKFYRTANGFVDSYLMLHPLNRTALVNAGFSRVHEQLLQVTFILGLVDAVAQAWNPLKNNEYTKEMTFEVFQKCLVESLEFGALEFKMIVPDVLRMAEENAEFNRIQEYAGNCVFDFYEDVMNKRTPDLVKSVDITSLYGDYSFLSEFLSSAKKLTLEDLI